MKIKERVAVINGLAVIIAALIGFTGGITPYLLQGNSNRNNDVIQSKDPEIMSDDSDTKQFPPLPKVWLENFAISSQNSYSTKGYELGERDSWLKRWDKYENRDSSGEKRSHGIYVRSWEYVTIEVDYEIGDLYSGIRGTYTVGYNSIKWSIPTELIFYSVDSMGYPTAIGDKFLINGGTEPIDFDIALDGVDTLRIGISSAGGEKEEFFVGLVDVYFY